MTSVNVTENKYSVSVTEGATTVVTAKAPGPQGPGFPDGNLGDVTSSNTGASVVVNSGAITNAKVNDSAAIAGTKISPDFGSQNITTTGNAVFGGNLTVSGTTTTINTQTLDVEDINVTLGKIGSPTDITANNGGISLLGDTTKTFQWLNATDSWTSSEHIALPDNKKLQLGDSQDLQIFHDSNHSNIKNITGNFSILSDTILLKNAANSESFIRCQNDGVELYHANSLKLATYSGGFNLTGKLNVTGDIDIPDNSKLLIGTGDDLQIYHDGSQSVIKDNGTGQLLISGENTVAITNAAGTENYARFINNGAVELYYDNVKKLETTNNGVTVSGNLLASSDGNTSINILDTGHGFSASTLSLSNGGRDLDIKAPKDIRLKPTDGESGIVIESNAAVELYHDNVKKAETTATGFNVEGTVTCDDILLANTIKHEGQTNTKIEFDGTQIKLFSNDVQRLNISQFAAFLQTGYKLSFLSVSGESPYIRSFGTNNSDIQIGVGTDSMAQFKRDGAVELYYDNALKFTTKSFGATAFGTLTANGGDIKTINATSSTDTNSFLLANSTGNALQVTHTSSNSYIRNLVGSLFIEPKSGETGIKVIPDGAVELYYNGVEKLKTQGWGVNITGTLNANGVTAQEYSITSGGFIPSSDNNNALGSSTKRFSTLHSVSLNTGDINMSNLHNDGNEVDGSKGSWTLQEGADDLFIINRVSGKKYKFNLTEIN